MTLDLFLEILGTVVGIFYLYWEYRASMKVWLAGILMPAISLFVYWKAGLYADFGINIYYLIAAIYGYVVWKYGRTESDKFRPIRQTPKSLWLVLMALTGVTFWAIGEILVRFTNSTVPWWDSFTTALSIVGMIMLARKWVEQWFVWIMVDVVCCGLYFYKGIYFYGVLYGAYAVIACFGYRAWKKKMLVAYI